MFPTSLCYILGGIVAITAILVLYLVVLPRNLDGTFNNKFLQFLHDYFHFKKLYIEEVLKFIFVLATVSCVCVGAFMLLGYNEVWHPSGQNYKESTAGVGLALMLGGPISLRLSYELVMMLVLAVKNIMEINNKMLKKETPTAEAPVHPANQQTVVTESPNRVTNRETNTTNPGNEQNIEKTIMSLYDMILDSKAASLNGEKCVLNREKALDMLDETIDQLSTLGLWQETKENGEEE